MHVSQSRHVRAAVASAALIATGATLAGIGVANAEPSATSTPARYQESGNMFSALRFPTLPGTGSTAEQAVADAVATPEAAVGASAAAFIANAVEEAAPAAEPAAEPAPAPAPEPAPAPAPLVPADKLARILPQMPADKIAQYVAPLSDAMVRGGIDTPIRQAAFIAQLAVESDSFRTFEEYASGSAYEGRSDLGNTQPGDGVRYKGRGAIQVTGRHNYEEVSKFTGIDFVANPELMAAPENAFITAVWYWTSRNLNNIADGPGIVRVSELVNGGHYGLADRMANFARGLDVLSHP
ncbi:glycoside hydrolase family 19 protein [Rhodococcus gannanensis]|uniref:Glycoside hydrolase family 19 protein n=1 Tax=Rhodococcus gannanensis TaxID=1960308 RepID=A0ABW4P815_9NOCA